MQKAIELNDNRGVYRSKLLLDEDLAARSASLGRIYNDLGFQQLGLVQGWKSVNADPSNYSAHRLLADNYASRPRHEIARVSELLQSQLLQPINVNPIQPSLAESNLLILNGSGPSNTSFNEFNPLFARNRLALQTSGIYGSNNTWGEEVVQSGLWNKFSYSLGQFHYETDGFRQNNDLKRDIYNVFAQGALTSKINIQAEYRRSEREQGDLHLYFNPDQVKRNKRFEIEQDTARIGLRLSILPELKFIFSGIHSDSHENKRTEDIDSRESGSNKLDQESYQMEGLLLFKKNWLNISLGFGTYRNKGIDEFDNPGEPLDKFSFIDEHRNAYIYTYLSPFPSMTWTLGLSYDSVDTTVKVEKINPKIGVQWNLTDNLLLRAAYFHTVQRSIIADQTIEPTQVSGFNQFYDDFNGAISKRFGVGLDAKFTDNLSSGLEYMQRKLAFDSFGSKGAVTNRRKERLLRGYFYWTPHPFWAISVEAEFEKFIRSPEDLFVVGSGEPLKVTELSLPLGIRYFHPSGFFAGIGGNFVHQKIENLVESRNISGKEDFFLLDAKLGYRFPKRFGSFSIEAKNLFDTEFNYEDSSIQTQREESNPRFIPSVAVFMNLTLAF
jgi:outer membrane receptor protein involved in Fe transport